MTDCVYSADQCAKWPCVDMTDWPVSANWPCVDMTDWPVSANWPYTNMTDCVTVLTSVLADPVLIWQTVFTVLTSVCWLTLCWYDRLCYSADQCLLSDPVLIWQTDQCLLTDPALIWQTDQCLTDPVLIWQTVLQCWPVSASWPCVDMTDCVYSADQCLLTDPVLRRWLCLQCWPVSAILASTWF